MQACPERQKRCTGRLGERFGKVPRPAAILMTHGHADHAGGLEELANLYDAPVYAHPLEMPYLIGEAAYPQPDPFVGGGLMSLASPLFSSRAIRCAGPAPSPAGRWNGAVFTRAGSG